MRSRSSLVSHLIGSHPEVAGYFENHLKLRTSFELVSLSERVSTLTGQKLAGKWIFDKILHNSLVVSPRLLNRPNVRPIFLVRDPVETIASISSHLADKGYDDRRAVRYYLKRVNELNRLISGCTHCLLLNSADIIGDTERTLRRFRNFLGVDLPFSETYSIGTLTGQRMFGDSSEAIQSGRILENRSATISLPKSLPFLEEAQEAYKMFEKTRVESIGLFET